MARMEAGMVGSGTGIGTGMLSMTGSIGWSWPAGISLTAAASDPSVSVYQWEV